MPDVPDAGALYRELSPAVLGYLRAQRVPDPEDTLGEVFLQVARDLRRRRFRGDAAAARRWVFSIAHNRAMDAHRHRRRHPVEPSDLVPPPATAIEHPPSETDEELLAAVAALGDDQRDVVLLRFVADLSIEEVARLTGRGAGAVKALQHRALENLRRALREPGS